MKKLMLNAAAILFVGVAAVNAQSPSTTPAPADPSTSSPSMQQQQPQQSQKQQPRGPEWTKVEASQIPTPVQETLEADKYKGWESSGVYFNKNTRQYSVDVRGRDGAMASTYNFDANGKVVGTTGSASSSSPNETGSASGSAVPAPKPGPSGSTSPNNQ